MESDQLLSQVEGPSLDESTRSHGEYVSHGQLDDSEFGGQGEKSYNYEERPR